MRPALLATLLVIGVAVILGVALQPPTFIIGPSPGTAADVLDRWLQSMAGPEPRHRG
jgi:hypothetical protein